MRHGQAEARASSDAERALTAVGRSDCAVAARRLAGFFSPAASPVIYHSPFLRTTQSAAALHAAMSDNVVAPQAADDLLGDNSSSRVLQWLEAIHSRHVASDTDAANLVIVSHQPLVSQLLSLLIDADRSAHAGGNYAMAPASFACLEYEFCAAGNFVLHSLNHPHNDR